MGTKSRRPVIGAMSTLVVLLAGCAGSGGEADLGEVVEADRSSQGPTVDPAAVLEASTPRGKYAGTYVIRSTDVPGAKAGERSTSTYVFTLGECSATECSGTVKAPGKGSYTWNGRALLMTFDEIASRDNCVDGDGAVVRGATFRFRTEHGARAATARPDGSAPARLEGSYQQTTVFSDFRGGCEPSGPTTQHAKFSLVLKRR
ncbi:MAG: hypothetical protein ACRDOM_10770 [Nocardioides sp.]